MINPKTVTYVRTVAEEGSFRKAAEKLYISQPSLSESILKAEKEYGVLFFNRKTKPIVLTYAGEIFLKEAEKIEQLDEQLTRKLSDISNNAAGRIIVGEAPTMSAGFIPKLFKIFHETFPNVQLSLREGSSHDLIEDVIHGYADLAFVSCNQNIPELAAIPVVDRELLLTHTVQNEKTKENIQTLSVETLHKEPFILLKEGREVRNLANDLFERGHIHPHIAYETKSYPLSLQMAVAGLGWAFIVDTGEYTNHNMQYFRVDGIQEMYHVRLIYRKNSYLSNPMNHFIELSKQIGQ